MARNFYFSHLSVIIYKSKIIIIVFARIVILPPSHKSVCICLTEEKRLSGSLARHSRSPYNDVCRNSYIRWLITQHASQQTTIVSLYNILSPQRSDCTMTPIRWSSTNLSDQQLGANCWDWGYPLNNMQIDREEQISLFRYLLDAKKRHDMPTSCCHKQCQLVHLALGVERIRVRGTAGTEGLWPWHKSRGDSCTCLSPVKTTRPSGERGSLGFVKG